MKRVISALLASAVFICTEASAYWDIKESEITGLGSLYAAYSSYYIIYSAKSETYNVYDLHHELVEQTGKDDLTQEFIDRYSAEDRTKYSAADIILPEPTYNPLPSYEPKAAEELPVPKELDGKYAYFTADGTQLTDYIYDTASSFSRSQGWQYHFETPHGNPTSTRCMITGAFEYATVTQNGAKKYLDTDLTEIDIHSRERAFYTELVYNGGLALGFLRGAGGNPSVHGSLIGILSDDGKTYRLLASDYGISDITKDLGDCFIFKSTAGKYGVMNVDGEVYIKPEYDYLEKLTNGLIRAAVKKDIPKSEIQPYGSAYDCTWIDYAGNPVLESGVYPQQNWPYVDTEKKSSNILYTETSIPYFIGPAYHSEDHEYISSIPETYGLVRTNGGFISFGNYSPRRENGSLMVPVGEFAGALGCTIEVNGGTLTVRGYGNTISFDYGENRFDLNGTDYELAAPAYCTEVFWLVPAEELARALGFVTEYSEESNILYVY